MIFSNRRNYIINTAFQIKMIIISLVMTLPVVCLFYLAYSYFINIFIRRIEEMDHNVASALIGFLGQFEADMKFVVLVGTIVILFFNAIFFLFLSHAIAGPIEKLKAHLLAKSENVTTGPFKIRASDFFPELPGFVNKAFKDEELVVSANSTKPD